MQSHSAQNTTVVLVSDNFRSLAGTAHPSLQPAMQDVLKRIYNSLHNTSSVFNAKTLCLHLNASLATIHIQLNDTAQWSEYLQYLLCHIMVVASECIPHESSGRREQVNATLGILLDQYKNSFFLLQGSKGPAKIWFDPETEETVLTLAAKHDNFGFINLLLNIAEEVNKAKMGFLNTFFMQKNKKQHSALLSIVFGGHRPTLERALRAIAKLAPRDARCVFEQADEWKYTVLHRAAFLPDKPEIGKLLLDVAEQSIFKQQNTIDVKAYEAAVRAQSSHGNTPLMVAAHTGNTPFVEELFNRIARVLGKAACQTSLTESDGYGYTALHRAVQPEKRPDQDKAAEETRVKGVVQAIFLRAKWVFSERGEIKPEEFKRWFNQINRDNQNSAFNLAVSQGYLAVVPLFLKTAKEVFGENQYYPYAAWFAEHGLLGLEAANTGTDQNKNEMAILLLQEAAATLSEPQQQKWREHVWNQIPSFIPLALEKLQGAASAAAIPISAIAPPTQPVSHDRATRKLSYVSTNFEEEKLRAPYNQCKTAMETITQIISQDAPLDQHAEKTFFDQLTCIQKTLSRMQFSAYLQHIVCYAPHSKCTHAKGISSIA